MVELLLILRIRLGVASREFGNLALCVCHLRPEDEVPAIEKGLKVCGALGIDVVSKANQIQIVDHLLLQQAVQIGGSRKLESREAFFGDARSADDIAPFEHQDSPSGASQIPGGYESVVASANDDGIV